MYHYVRNLKSSRYPEIKGLDVELFKEQLRYILKYYKVIKMEELIDAVKNKSKLADNSLLLTFDDGYQDHYEFVFPILNELGLQGSFFPPAKAILNNQVLDVNKIHFILACVTDHGSVIRDIFSLMDQHREEFSLDSNVSYETRLKTAESRYDPKEVIFIKRMLQKELPEKLRNIIVNYLFNKHVSKDERSFARTLYMSMDQLKEMKSKGMFIGSHGYAHYWLNTLPQEEQEQEVDLSLNFLNNIGCDTKDFVFCYPYGMYNETTLSVLKAKGCALALTTQVGIADLSQDPLTLNRLDTNDLPKDSEAVANKWTLEISSEKSFKQ